MPHYKLYYFVNRGRAEAIRLVFKMVGKDFENEILTTETWPPLKNDMPLYQVPVLEIDGKTKIGQSVAILRFLGNEFGIAGTDNLEKAKLDMIADCLTDINNHPDVARWPYVLMGLDPQDKEEYFKKKVLPALEKLAPIIEKLLLENGKNGLFSGDKESWVDIYAFETFTKFVDFGDANALEAYPHIKALIARISILPGIKEHIAQREKTSC